MVLAQLRAEGLEGPGGVMGALPKFNVKDLIQVSIMQHKVREGHTHFLGHTLGHS